MSKPYYDQIPFDGKSLHPMDKVILADGREAIVNSAHYISDDGVQKFNICQQDTDILYRADEVTFLHRCIFHQYKDTDQYKCECGEFYTTMADFIKDGKLML